MLAVVIGELAVLVVLWLAFAAWHARSHWWRHPDGRPNWVGRQLMAVALVGLAETASLMALGLGHPPPLWLYALGFAAVDAVTVGWLLLLWHARNQRDEERP
jgi:protein-S-isoprenylcysteine O-methyltransferase Ste14